MLNRSTSRRLRPSYSQPLSRIFSFFPRCRLDFQSRDMRGELAAVRKDAEARASAAASARAHAKELTAMRLGSDETASSPDDVPDDSSDASSVFKVEHHMAAEASPADLRRREQAATTTHPFPPTSALRNTTCACAGATEKGGDRCRERGGAATTRGCQRQRRQPTSRIVARRNRAGPRVR